MNKEIKKYIADARKAGIPKQEIRKSLADSGWSKKDIDRAFCGPLCRVGLFALKLVVVLAVVIIGINPAPSENYRLTRSTQSLTGSEPGSSTAPLVVSGQYELVKTEVKPSILSMVAQMNDTALDTIKGTRLLMFPVNLFFRSSVQEMASGAWESKCLVDTDCVYVSGFCGCGGGGGRAVISKRRLPAYEKSMQDALSEFPGEFGCPAVMSKSPSCVAAGPPACRFGQCVMTISPIPGLLTGAYFNR